MFLTTPRHISFSFDFFDCFCKANSFDDNLELFVCGVYLNCVRFFIVLPFA